MSLSWHVSIKIYTEKVFYYFSVFEMQNQNQNTEFFVPRNVFQKTWHLSQVVAETTTTLHVSEWVVSKTSVPLCPVLV